MKVSIALAAYRGEDYLPEQLESLGRQTRKPDQVVITDDSPDDALRGLVADCAKRFGLPITYVHNETNLGFARNFEKALSLVDGDIVLFCDQDDSWYPEKIETLVTALEESPDKLAVMNDAAFADANLQPLGTTKMGQFGRAGLGQHDFVMGCCAAMRRELVDIATPIPQGFWHDTWILGFSNVLQATGRLEQVLQLYRMHGSNLSKGFHVNTDPRRGRLGFRLRKLVTRLRNMRSSDNMLREQRLLRHTLARAAEHGLDDDPRFSRALDEARDRLRRIDGRLAIRASAIPARIVPVAGNRALYTRFSQRAKDLLARKITVEGHK